jgi:type II secretory pathway component PulF
MPSNSPPGHAAHRGRNAHGHRKRQHLHRRHVPVSQGVRRLELAIIRMGEQSGVLPKCLKDLSAFLEWKEDIRSTVKRAAIYPSFVIIVIVAVIGVWVGYVLPQLAGLLAQMGVTLPVMTRFVLDLSDFCRDWWVVMALTAMLVGIAAYLFQRTDKGGVLFHRHVLNLPIIGGVISNIAMARLSHNFATMYQAGMSINGIFEILMENVLGNRYLENLLKSAFNAIQQGDSISDGFEKAGGFPSPAAGRRSQRRNHRNPGCVLRTTGHVL